MLALPAWSARVALVSAPPAPEPKLPRSVLSATSAVGRRLAGFGETAETLKVPGVGEPASSADGVSVSFKV